jgi:hypothetical protein
VALLPIANAHQLKPRSQLSLNPRLHFCCAGSFRGGSRGGPIKNPIPKWRRGGPCGAASSVCCAGAQLHVDNCLYGADRSTGGLSGSGGHLAAWFSDSDARSGEFGPTQVDETPGAPRRAAGWFRSVQNGGRQHERQGRCAREPVLLARVTHRRMRG